MAKTIETEVGGRKDGDKEEKEKEPEAQEDRDERKDVGDEEAEAENEDEIILKYEEEFADVIALISCDDPKYTVWLHILRFVDDIDDGPVTKVAELAGLLRLVDAERVSNRIRDYIPIRKKDHEEHLERNAKRLKKFSAGDAPDWYKAPDIDPRLTLELPLKKRKELMYEWGADKAAFGSTAMFETFCRKAGIDPVKDYFPCRKYAFPDADPSHTWTNQDNTLTFMSSVDPRDPDSYYIDPEDRTTRIGGLVHYFGLTGVRSRAYPLERWFHTNADWDEMCYGGRAFC